MSATLDHLRAQLAAAVAAAAHGGPGDRAGDGTVGFGTDPAALVSAWVLDTAIAAVDGRRAAGGAAPDGSSRPPPAAPLDAAVFDDQTVDDLLEFLQHARQGLLTPEEVAYESGLWQQLLGRGWPPNATDGAVVARAVDILAAVPNAGTAPPPAIPAEPANDLEHAMRAVARDERHRPALWRALHRGEIVLPVVAYDVVRPEGANFQFLSAPTGATPLVLGFATEERFDHLLPDGSQVSRVTPLGRQLPRFWPDGHWLMINPGYDNSVVLGPWEIAGLPDGGRSELPHPRAVEIDAPAADDGRAGAVAAALAAAGAHRADCWWARVRPAGAPRGAAWQDVIVVAARPASGEAAAAQAVSAALPAADFPRALVLGRQAEAGHPFIEAAVRAGRCLG